MLEDMLKELQKAIKEGKVEIEVGQVKRKKEPIGQVSEATIRAHKEVKRKERKTMERLKFETEQKLKALKFEMEQQAKEAMEEHAEEHEAAWNLVYKELKIDPDGEYNLNSSTGIVSRYLDEEVTGPEMEADDVPEFIKRMQQDGFKH